MEIQLFSLLTGNTNTSPEALTCQMPWVAHCADPPWRYELQNTSLLRSLRIPFTADGGSSSTGVVLWPAFSSLFCFFYGVFKPTFTNDSYSQCFLNWSYFQSSQTPTSEKSKFSLIPLLTTLQTDQCWHLL